MLFLFLVLLGPTRFDVRVHDMECDELISIWRVRAYGAQMSTSAMAVD